VSDPIARLLLLGFDREEADDVVRDLRDLAAKRGRVRGSMYFWTELVKYPVMRAWDRLRYDSRGPREPRGRGGGGVDTLVKDVRYAVRSLSRNAGFSIMAIVILAISIGSTTAMVSIVHGVLLEPLPLDEPDRVVSLWLGPVDGSGRSRMTPGNFRDLQSLDGTFSHAAAFRGETASMLLGDESVFLRGGAVTHDYFGTLGVEPMLGGGFREGDEEVGGPAVIVLSHHVWSQYFAADPGIVGTTIVLDGRSFLVVGVAPGGVYPTQATVSAEIPFTATNQDFFVPLRFGPEGWANRRSHVLGAIGRLAPDASPDAAAAALDALAARLRESEPLNRTETFVMRPFTEEVVGDVRSALVTLLGSVLLVLLIAVANVGALFVLRSDDRSGEMYVRTALGAPRRRVLRQLGLESLVVTGLAAAAAVPLAQGALSLVRRLVPYQVPRLSEVAVAGAPLAATVAIALVVTALFAVAPALLSIPLGGPGTSAARGHTRGVAQRRLQVSVVALQAGLGVVVLVGAALFTRSYFALRAVDNGFSAQDTWTMSIPTSLETLERIVEGVRDIPGVSAAAIAYDHPLARSWGDSFLIEGVQLSDSEPAPSGSLRPFGEDYFRTVGIDVVDGRVPDRVDLAGPVAYAVINETLRDRWFAGRSPVGERIILPTAQRMGQGDGVFEIVGVVQDVRFLGPDQPVDPALYVPLSHFRAGASTLLVRPDAVGTDMIPQVRDVVRSAEAGLAVQRARRLSDVLNDLLARPRFNMTLLLSFGLMGLVLCGLGVYGLVGRVIVARYREIGIRMALGADRPGLALAVARSALRPLLAGTLVGLGVALALARWLRVALFEVAPTDPVSLAVSAAFVLTAGALAAVVPTVRGVCVSPASTLRSE
jgi:predicted permease